ncbi:MAG TPA: aldo/keto reductase [Arenibacter sp.]|nr:aldo/keto reductase [Arenibacter sp.]
MNFNKKHKKEPMDLVLASLGLGCWSFGGGQYWGEQSQIDVDKVVHGAVDMGVNYFDTAEAYNEGRSEESLGKAIKTLKRDDIIIGTKVNPFNCYPELLVKHCEASLQRLKTDYIDLYMIHWPIHSRSIKYFSKNQDVIDNPPTLIGAIEALRKLKKDGKIKYFGLSNYAKDRLLEVPEMDEISVNQLPYNLLCRAAEFDTIPFCINEGVPIISYMALLQGILTGKYGSLNEIPLWRRRTRHFSSKGTIESRHGEDGFEDATLSSLTAIQRISDETGISMADLAIKWVISNPAISCCLAGARTLEQLQKNVNAAQDPLDEVIKISLDDVTESLMNALGNNMDYYEAYDSDRTR